MTTRNVDDAIDDFFARYLATTGGPALAEHDPDEPSPCILTSPDADGMVRWRPVRQTPPTSVESVARALRTPLHPSAAAWLTRWWALPIEATSGDDLLCVNVAASLEGSERQVARVVDHVKACHRWRYTLSIPVAVGVNGGFFALANASGEVIFEDQGRPTRPLGCELAAWLDALVPLPL